MVKQVTEKVKITTRTKQVGRPSVETRTVKTPEGRMTIKRVAVTKMVTTIVTTSRIRD